MMADNAIALALRAWVRREPTWWLVVREYIEDRDPGDESDG